MSSPLRREDVAKVAKLARLTLSEGELDMFTEQLGQVLEHARGHRSPRSGRRHSPPLTPSDSSTWCAETLFVPACRATTFSPWRRTPKTAASPCRASWEKRREKRPGDRAGRAQWRSSAEGELSRALTAIAARNEELHVFLHVDEEGALEVARTVDQRIAKGEDVGALAGVPIALKDNLCQIGVPTTAASRILSGWRPPYSATVVERVLAAGAVPVGKTNLDEFAMGSSTENSAFGPTRNPLDPTRGCPAARRAVPPPRSRPA